MKSVRLDKRLLEILKNVRGDSLADIGCDHGKLAAASVLSRKIKWALACDISPKSLNKAKKLIEGLGLSKEIECRDGDGLYPVADGEVDTVVIAGLGGDEIAKILKNASSQNKRFSNYVLSPNTRAEKVRAEAMSQGLGIVGDCLILCGKKYYPVIALSANDGKTRLSDDEIIFGAEFWNDDGFKSWAQDEMNKLSKMIEDVNAPELINRYNGIKRAYEKASASETLKDI